jgi:hypothetical protein
MVAATGQILTSPVVSPPGQVAGSIPYNAGPQVTAIPVDGGTFVANGASAVTVANINLTANSIILVTLKTVGGTVGALPVPQTVTPGTGFTIAGTSGDTSTYNYIILG